MTVISPLLFGFSLLLSLWVILPGFGIAINHLSKPRGGSAKLHAENRIRTALRKALGEESTK